MKLNHEINCEKFSMYNTAISVIMYSRESCYIYVAYSCNLTGRFIHSKEMCISYMSCVLDLAWKCKKHLTFI